MSRIVLGVGMSSKATPGDVRSLADRVVRQAGLGAASVTALATRARLADDPRVAMGFPVVAVDDGCLLDWFPEPSRALFPARVAEGCALIAAGPGSSLVVPTVRASHATAALAAGGDARVPPSDTDADVTSASSPSGGDR